MQQSGMVSPKPQATSGAPSPGRAPPAAGGTALDAGRKPALSPVGIFGAVVVGIAILGLVLNLTLPWLSMPVGEESETLDRGDLTDTQLDYLDRQMGWPLTAFIIFMIAGVFLIGIDFIPGLWVGIHRAIQTLLLLLIGLFGFLTALTGTRWLGLYITDLMGASDATHLHVVPYLNLVLGFVVLIGVAMMLKKPLAVLFSWKPPGAQVGDNGVRSAAIVLLVAMASLLVLPLLPYGIEADGDDRDFVGEVAFANWAQFGFMDDDTEGAANALSTARAMIWIVLYAALGVFVLAALERTLGGQQIVALGMQVFALAGVPLIIGLIFTIMFYVRLAASDFYSISINHFLPLVYLALVVVYVLFLTKVTMPVLKTMDIKMETSQ